MVFRFIAAPALALRAHHKAGVSGKKPLFSRSNCELDSQMNPWHRLPPLRSLRVLEAAVRHENYTRAADELALTHSAVSHQIHALEEALGVRLLQREGRRMRPTESGRQLALDVRTTPDTLNAAVE